MSSARPSAVPLGRILVTAREIAVFRFVRCANPFSNPQQLAGLAGRCLCETGSAFERHNSFHVTSSRGRTQMGYRTHVSRWSRRLPYAPVADALRYTGGAPELWRGAANNVTPIGSTLRGKDEAPRPRAGSAFGTPKSGARRIYSLNCRSFAFIWSISACWLLMMLRHSALISGSCIGACSHIKIALAWCGIIERRN